MENHLKRVAVLCTYYFFAALILIVKPGSTTEIAQVQKQFKSDRLVFYNNKNQAVWDTKIKDSSTILLSIKGDGSFTLSNKANNKVSSSELKLEEYYGKMVQLDGNVSKTKMVWIVGVDGKRRLVPNQETYKCLKGVGMEDPVSVSTEILEQLPNIENAWAICGTNTMRPNDVLLKGSYLQAGDYKFLLTDRDLMLTKSGNQIWANNERAVQLMLQTDGNLVATNSKNEDVWDTQTFDRTPGVLVLENDGSLRLYDAKRKQIWEP